MVIEGEQIVVDVSPEESGRSLLLGLCHEMGETVTNRLDC